MPTEPVTIVKWLQSAGPYAVTLIVLVWLFLERKERVSAQEDAKNLRDDAAKKAGDAATAMATYGEGVRDALREHDARIDKMLEQAKEPRRGAR